MGKFLFCCLTLIFYAYLDSVLRDKQFYTPIDHIQPEPDHFWPTPVGISQITRVKPCIHLIILSNLMSNFITSDTNLITYFR